MEGAQGCIVLIRGHAVLRVAARGCPCLTIWSHHQAGQGHMDGGDLRRSWRRRPPALQRAPARPAVIAARANGSRSRAEEPPCQPAAGRVSTSPPSYW